MKRIEKLLKITGMKFEF